MALQSTDEFLVHRKGTLGNLSPRQYYKITYKSLQEEIKVPLAIQETDFASGVPGLMYPGPSLRYDPDGQLNVDFPTSLRFIDVLTEEHQYPQPLSYIDHQGGDFYLVSIPESVQIILSSEFWPGIDGTEDLSVLSQPKAQGSVYRATTGLYVGFGGIANTEVDLINITSTIADGLLIDVAISQGSMKIDSIVIQNGGTNYADDDVIEYKSTLSGAAGAYFKVTTDGAGAVVDLDAIVSPDNLDDRYQSETAGYGFQMPLTTAGRIDNARTRAKSGNGEDLRVNVEVKDGKLQSVSLSPFSEHNNYRDGDTLVVYDGVDREGDGLIEVSILTDNVGYIYANNGDKVIYKGATLLETARWLHVPANGNDKAIIGIRGDDLGRVRDDETGEYIFYNPDLALRLGNDAANKLATLAIKVAHYEYNLNGLIDANNSYAGLMLPEEKEKLLSVYPGATPGSVESIETVSSTDYYSGIKYSVIEIVTSPETLGDVVTLKIRKSQVGMFGTVMMTSKEDFRNLLVTKSSNGTNLNVPMNAVPSADDLTDYVMPKNICSLRKLS